MGEDGEKTDKVKMKERRDKKSRQILYEVRVENEEVKMKEKKRANKSRRIVGEIGEKIEEVKL